VNICPSCGQPIPRSGEATERELDVLFAWWLTGSVTAAAEMAGVGEQRAKNLLARCRSRSGVHSNEALLMVQLDALRSRIVGSASHNVRGSEAA
jgi:hypothetical protein